MKIGLLTGNLDDFGKPHGGEQIEIGVSTCLLPDGGMLC
jgi:hypothetical protein